MYGSVWCTDSALRQYMYFLVMSQHTIHYYMNINELRQCCFDSGASPTGYVLQPVSLISMASVVQTKLRYDCVVDLKGHPIICYTGDSCTSALRILRTASTHFVF